MNNDILAFSLVLHGLLKITSKALQRCTNCCQSLDTAVLHGKLPSSLVFSYSSDKQQHFIGAGVKMQLVSASCCLQIAGF